MSLKNKNSLACMFSHNSDDWATPSGLYRHFMDLGFYDPCPLCCSVDCLSMPWKEYNFVNPPFSKIPQFIEKAIDEVDKDNSIVMLLPVRTDTKWFERLFELGLAIIFIKGRLHFNDSKNSAPFPCMLVAFSNVCNRFNTTFVVQSYDRLLEIDFKDFADYGL